MQDGKAPYAPRAALTAESTLQDFLDLTSARCETCETEICRGCGSADGSSNNGEEASTKGECCAEGRVIALFEVRIPAWFFLTDSKTGKRSLIRSILRRSSLRSTRSTPSTTCNVPPRPREEEDQRRRSASAPVRKGSAPVRGTVPAPAWAPMLTEVQLLLWLVAVPGTRTKTTKLSTTTIARWTTATG